MSSEKKILSFEDITAKSDIETIDVEVPEWGGVVRLTMLSGEQMVTFWEKNKKSENEGIVNLIAMSAVKEDGTPLFASAEHVAKLKTKSFKVLKRLSEAALRLNGLDDKKKQEEEVKNA